MEALKLKIGHYLSFETILVWEYCVTRMQTAKNEQNFERYEELYAKRWRRNGCLYQKCFEYT